MLKHPLVLLWAALGALAGAAAAGSALALDMQGLVDRAELVIEGRVVSRRVLADASGRPETEFVVAVDTTHLGSDETLRTFRFPGGTLPGSQGGTGLLVPGLPELTPGEEVLLFLTRESPNGWRMPVGLSQGKYRKVRDAQGRLRLEREHGELELYDAGTRALRHAAARDSADYQGVRAALERAIAVRRTREARR
jgi:hypothetical protein